MTKKKKQKKQHLMSSRQSNIAIRSQANYFQGPLPPPAVLEHYNSIVPDAAERILVMAENQSRHRQRMEKDIISSNIFNERLGVVFAFILVLVAITGGIFLIASNKSAEGLSAIIASLCALAGVFIVGKHYQNKKELAEKNSKTS